MPFPLGGIALVVATTFSGAIATYAYDDRATWGARVCAGAAIGMALLGFCGYLFCAAVGAMTPATLLLAVFAACLPLLLLLNGAIRRRAARDQSAAWALPRSLGSRRIVYIFVGALTLLALSFVFRGAMYADAGSICTNNNNNLGDLPFHFSIIEGFLHGANFPPQDTEFAGARLTYPFLIDLVTAQYMQAGASATVAFFLQNMLLTIALVGLFYRATLLFTRSVFAALVAPLLVLFSGGAGFYHLIADPLNGLSFLQRLRDLPREYTMGENEGLRWGNALTILLTTQRGLPIAIPFALMVWTIWWEAREHEDGQRLRRFAAAGVLTGMLPLIHGHTFLMLLLVGAGQAVQEPWRARGRVGGDSVRQRLLGWVLYFGLALALALPQVALLAQSTSVKGATFFGWEPGWVALGHNFFAFRGLNYFAFWGMNLGLFLPLLLIALSRPSRPGLTGEAWRVGWISRSLYTFYLPFLVCFLLPNLVRLAPWDMDNLKILLYWHIASAIVIAQLLARVWRSRRFFGGKAVALLLVLGLTLSGALDAFRISTGNQRSEIFDAEGQAFARAVQAATSPHALLLHYPLHNHPILLAGRHLLMGYEGHLWSHGIDYAQRHIDVQHIYTGAPDAAALLAKYGIDYVVVGPPEHDDPEHNGIVTQDSLWQRYPIAVRSGPYMLYDVRRR